VRKITHPSAAKITGPTKNVYKPAPTLAPSYGHLALDRRQDIHCPARRRRRITVLMISAATTAARTIST
jgi:hypothetical protein